MADIEPGTIYSASKKRWSRRPPGTPVTPQKRWAGLNREKLEAQAMVRRAIRAGKLRRGRCEICGSMLVDAHHPSYNKPLTVIWLCRKHHQQLHAAERAAIKEVVTNACRK